MVRPVLRCAVRCWGNGGCALGLGPARRGPAAAWLAPGLATTRAIRFGGDAGHPGAAPASALLPRRPPAGAVCFSRGFKEHADALPTAGRPPARPIDQSLPPPAGAIYFSRGFKEHANANLAELELGYNEIKDEGACALAQARAPARCRRRRCVASLPAGGGDSERARGPTPGDAARAAACAAAAGAAAAPARVFVV